MRKWGGELRFLMALFEEWKEEAERWHYPYLEIDLGDMELELASDWLDAILSEQHEAILVFPKSKDRLFLLAAGWERYFHLPDLGRTPMSFSTIEEVRVVLEDFLSMLHEEKVLIKDRLAYY